MGPFCCVVYGENLFSSGKPRTTCPIQDSLTSPNQHLFLYLLSLDIFIFSIFSIPFSCNLKHRKYANRSGFVHTDMEDDSDPGYDEVKYVFDMFAKHSLKAIQKEHPLFARGSDDKLTFSVRPFCLFNPLYPLVFNALTPAPIEFLYFLLSVKCCLQFKAPSSLLVISHSLSVNFRNTTCFSTRR